MSTGWITNAVFHRHDTGPSHPERAARLAAIETRIETCGLADEIERLEAPPIDPARLATVHDPRYVARVEAAIARGARVLDEGDTHVSADSWRAALCAAGGAITAVERVMSGRWKNAFVAARPPGHHAERDEAMGFCLFNNVALAAHHLRHTLGLERVAILDWDVHHGNGTQHLFEDDPSVYFASLHQWPLYPGTGAASERGIGAGEGATLNAPQPPRAGDREWLDALERVVLPAIEAFRPQFLLISAGFDAHARDPLAQTELSTEAYGRMTELVIELAQRTCEGRIVSLLEGGYDLVALAECAEVHIGALSSARSVQRPSRPRVDDDRRKEE